MKYIVLQSILKRLMLAELEKASDHHMEVFQGEEFMRTVRVYTALKNCVLALDACGYNFVVQIGEDDYVDLDDLPGISNT